MALQLDVKKIKETTLLPMQFYIHSIVPWTQQPEHRLINLFQWQILEMQSHHVSNLHHTTWLQNDPNQWQYLMTIEIQKKNKQQKSKDHRKNPHITTRIPNLSMNTNNKPLRPNYLHVVDTHDPMHRSNV